VVGLVDYWNFVKFSSGAFGLFLFLGSSIGAAFFQLAISWYLADWASKDLEEQQLSVYPRNFGISILVYILLSVARSAVVSLIVIASGTNMHNAMSARVLRAKILFFDSNPMGRILTRFSKDMVTIDFIFGFLFPMIANGIFRATSVVISICIINPYALIPSFIMLGYMIWVLKRS
jgi:ABC-type siderophore export system fused ATPase/permease subunit